MKAIGGLVLSALLAPLLGGAGIYAAEFEVLDRFSVDGYSVFRGSADIPGGSLAVGRSALVVKGGNVGVGTASPAASLNVVSTDTVSSAFKVQTGSIAGTEVVISTSGGLTVSGEIKVGYSASACNTSIAGTLRWYDGHVSVCNGTNWRQLDNQPPPTIASITPASGILTGGTAVTIAGTGFNQGLEVLIDGVTATAIIVVSATQITAATPARPVGAKDVKITNPDGQYAAGVFTYNPLPTISDVSPVSGPQGTVITITGTGFVSGAGVKFGETAATVNTLSASQITATAPSSATSGARNVTVTNPDTGSVAQTNGFSYTFLASGGTESISGAYRIHTFTGGGTLTVATGGTVEALIVGGGGAGGASLAGGGGGGAVLYAASKAVAQGSYTIVIGAGGTGYADTAVPGTNGGATTAFGETATGGTGACGRYSAPPSPLGANGGGGAASSVSPRMIGTTGIAPSAGAGVTVYAGRKGGDNPGNTGSNYPGGGGAGAGADGQTPANTDAPGGNGGNGVMININGNNWYWGGGGGGSSYTGVNGGGNGGLGGGGGGSANTGSGGTGGGSAINTGGSGLSGGGNSSASQVGGAGGTNTGGGGGAGDHEPGPGGAGGSGIVIVRYLK